MPHTTALDLRDGLAESHEQSTRKSGDCPTWHRIESIPVTAGVGVWCEELLASACCSVLGGGGASTTYLSGPTRDRDLITARQDSPCVQILSAAWTIWADRWGLGRHEVGPLRAFSAGGGRPRASPAGGEDADASCHPSSACPSVALRCGPRRRSATNAGLPICQRRPLADWQHHLTTPPPLDRHPRVGRWHVANLRTGRPPTPPARGQSRARGARGGRGFPASPTRPRVHLAWRESGNARAGGCVLPWGAAWRRSRARGTAWPCGCRAVRRRGASRAPPHGGGVAARTAYGGAAAGRPAPPPRVRRGAGGAARSPLVPLPGPPLRGAAHGIDTGACTTRARVFGGWGGWWRAAPPRTSSCAASNTGARGWMRAAGEPGRRCRDR